ncbi:glutathione S-transferase [Annulohypoxylon maeteangense]|uniref:glutathione S-transferase n=1 Tax=Annulohypoxylon maeteangense TaxID=1927788 RepID=UPI00200884D1|nr:glutathione S-transferase [Annulohypoxylon maeteangense]KAI0889334.1 glutathione S-transferase [Annulohypoxylon maeteangense]
MAPFGKIYSYPNNFRVERAQVAAAFNGLEVPLVEDFKMGVDNASPEFVAKFPMGKVPAFEGADGYCVAEGAAIATYIALSGPKKAQLIGADAKTQATISQWVFFSESELVGNMLPPATMVVFKMMPYNEQLYTTCVERAERALKRVNAELEGKKYLVGDQVTLADILVSGVLFFASKFLIDAEMRKEIPNVVTWMQHLATLPEFKPLGEFTLLETRAKP